MFSEHFCIESYFKFFACNVSPEATNVNFPQNFAVVKYSDSSKNELIELILVFVGLLSVVVFSVGLKT